MEIKKEFIEQIKDLLNYELDDKSEQAWWELLEEKCGNSDSDWFEIGSYYTKSKNPELIYIEKYKEYFRRK